MHQVHFSGRLRERELEHESSEGSSTRSSTQETEKAERRQLLPGKSDIILVDENYVLASDEEWATSSEEEGEDSSDEEEDMISLASIVIGRASQSAPTSSITRAAELEPIEPTTVLHRMTAYQNSQPLPSLRPQPQPQQEKKELKPELESEPKREQGQGQGHGHGQSSPRRTKNNSISALAVSHKMTAGGAGNPLSLVTGTRMKKETPPTDGSGSENASTGELLIEKNPIIPIHTAPLANDIHKKIIARREAKEQEIAAAINLLSGEERSRAADAFKHCDIFEEGRISEKGLHAALSLLGVCEPEDKIRELYLRRNQDLLDETNFLTLLGELRASSVDEEQVAIIQVAFLDLYHAALATKGKSYGFEQKDELGRPYLLAKDLRRILCTCGDNLNDEEADQLIRDCKPLYTRGQGTERAGGEGKIFFDQYRAMLLGGPG